MRPVLSFAVFRFFCGWALGAAEFFLLFPASLPMRPRASGDDRPVAFPCLRARLRRWPACSSARCCGCRSLRRSEARRAAARRARFGASLSRPPGVFVPTTRSSENLTPPTSSVAVLFVCVRARAPAFDAGNSGWTTSSTSASSAARDGRPTPPPVRAPRRRAGSGAARDRALAPGALLVPRGLRRVLCHDLARLQYSCRGHGLVHLRPL